MPRHGMRVLAVITSGLLLSTLALVAGAPARADIDSPVLVSTAAGKTSVPSTQGKAAGSGLWGYVGDIKTGTGTTGANAVFSYGIAISPQDGSVWVTDSAKMGYSTIQCLLLGMGGTSRCYAGKSRVMHYGKVGSDWAVGQYDVDGEYSAPAAGANAGVGALYQSLSDATVIDGSTLPNGQFGGVRGLAIADNGTAWIADPDAPIGAPSGVVNTDKFVRIINADETEGASFGTGPAAWTDRYTPGKFYYPVDIAKLNGGDFLVVSQTADLLQEFDPAGVWKKNILLDRPTNSAYLGDTGSRNPNGLAVDPTNGDILVNYARMGAQQIVERIDPESGALRQTIGANILPTDMDGFDLAVDPKTGNLYVAMENGQLYAFDENGNFLGRFSAFGTGTADGQVAQTVRGIAFDANGFMYVTVAQGTADTRVQILARTPDPVTNPSAVYACAVDGNGDNTGVVDRTTVNVNWTGVSEGVTSDGQAPVRDYVVEQSADAGATWSVVPTDATILTKQALSNLDAASTYQFRISAWNEAGNGDTATTAVAEPNCDLSVVDPGAITISKTVVDLGTAPASDTPYSFALSCTLGGSDAGLSAADRTFVLTAGQKRTVTVAADAVCVVSESSTGEFTTRYSDSDGSADGTVAIAAGGNAAVEVINTYPGSTPGESIVTKQSLTSTGVDNSLVVGSVVGATLLLIVGVTLTVGRKRRRDLQD